MPSKTNFLLIGLILFTLGVKAEPPITFSLETDQASQTLAFSVPPGLHFNEKAPSHVEALIKGTWQKTEKLKLNGPKALATWKAFIQPCDDVRALLYICDNGNTYCLPRALEFSCENGKRISHPWKAEAELTPPIEKVSEANFIFNDSDRALKLAKENHKPVLIDFFGIWCPPCNELDETVFNTPEFNSIQNQFILLKLDADSPASWTFKSQYHVTGYPTIIFTTQEGDEISRVIGYRSKKEFVSAMDSALKNKGNTLEQKKLKAEDSSHAAYELGLLYLNREQFYVAHYYLLRASRHMSLTDVKRNKVMSAELGLQAQGESLEDKKAYEKLLLKALEWYPRVTEVFDRVESLVAVSEELGDKDAKNKAYAIDVETAWWYINHPKAFKGTDFTKADLYELLGDAYQSRDEKQKSLDAYAQGAKEYLKEIKDNHLDEKTERGFNLERIYCLWKSGQVESAQKLYDDFEKLYPMEFTFFFYHARLLKELKLYKEAEEKGEEALTYSYGDNRLRVATVLAEIYLDDHKNSKALDVINKVIEKFILPTDKSIRTHRYYGKLLELKKKANG